MKTTNALLIASIVTFFLGSISLFANPKIDGMKSEMDKKISNFYDFSNMPDNESRAHMNKSIEAALIPYKERLKNASEDVKNAFFYTKKAITALHNNNSDLAIKDLKAASALFDTALVNNPNLSIVPIDINIRIEELHIKPNAIQSILREAQIALKEDRTQKARQLLAPLHEEIIIETTFLPLKKYHDTVNKTIQHLKKGDSNSALELLYTGIHELDKETTVIPLPLLKAKALIRSATDIQKRDVSRAKTLIKSAQRELNNAILLGYTDTATIEYKQLNGELEAVKSLLHVKY